MAIDNLESVVVIVGTVIGAVYTLVSAVKKYIYKPWMDMIVKNVQQDADIEDLKEDHETLEDLVDENRDRVLKAEGRLDNHETRLSHLEKGKN